MRGTGASIIVRQRRESAARPPGRRVRLTTCLRSRGSRSRGPIARSSGSLINAAPRSVSGVAPSSGINDVIRPPRRAPWQTEMQSRIDFDCREPGETRRDESRRRSPSLRLTGVCLSHLVDTPDRPGPACLVPDVWLHADTEQIARKTLLVVANGLLAVADQRLQSPLYGAGFCGFLFVPVERMASQSGECMQPNVRDETCRTRSVRCVDKVRQTHAGETEGRRAAP